MSSIAWVIRFCAVSYWELKVGVALYFSNQSPWSSGANVKGIDSLVAWLIPTIGLPELLTYLLSFLLLQYENRIILFRERKTNRKY